MRRAGLESTVDEPHLAEGPVARLPLARLLLKALVCTAGAAAFWCAPALAQPNPGVLPDGRGWELVSPAEKSGATVSPLGQAAQGLLGGLDLASEDGNALTYAATGPVEGEPEANRAPEGVQIISSRESSGWSSKDIITPHEKGEGVPSGEAQEYRLFSPDLSLAAVQPFGRPAHAEGEHPSKFQEPPLAGNAQEERGIYLRHNQACEVVKSPTCFGPIVTPANDSASEPFGEQIEYVSATPDLSRVVLRSRVPLTPKAAEEVFPLATNSFLYEWDAAAPEQLHLISKAPKKAEVEFEASPQLGFEKEQVAQAARNAVSSNGRVFWTTQEAEGLTLLFAHDSNGASMQVNVPEEGIKNPTKEKAEEHELESETRYQGASADGKRVFFTSTLRLTKSSEFSVAKKGPADLYACDLPAEITETSTCSTLTDLSIATPTPTEKPRSAEVLGAVLGNTDDGNTIYFAANRTLCAEKEGSACKETVGSAPNGEAAVEGKCKRPKEEKEILASATCNIYMEHFANGKWEPPRLVAVVSQDDATDWAVASGELGVHLNELTARLSPSGNFLAFQSDRPLTGFDNHDANSGKPDEEVFLYNAEGEGKLVCASCNPNPGHRPTGVFDKKEASGGEQKGLLVDPAGKVWNREGSSLEGRWLSGSIPGWTPLSSVYAPMQSRYLLDNGRLFFNSADALVPPFEGQVTQRQEIVEGTPMQVGVENVYEYEPNGVGSCGQANGCVSLISSGTSENESAFLEASVSGDDVFFVTAEKLFATDPDTSYDAYDAHVCSAKSPCITPPPPPAPPCEGEAGCKGDSNPVPQFGPGGTSLFSGTGNPPGKVEVRGEKEQSKKAKLSRKQLLAKALSKCRKQYKHAKKKRAACERRAHKRYGSGKGAKKK
jgi:WD40 repeat protein